MNEHSISENLKYLIKLHDGISILELSKKTQLPQPTLHHILSGQTKKPRAQALEQLAKFFSITVDQLTGKLPLPTIPNALKENLQISTVPIIDWNILINWPQDKTKIQSTNEIILERKLSQNSFALIMNNSNMEPLFPEKSILVFDAGKKLKDRDFGIVYLEKNNEIIFNRLLIDNLGYYIKLDQPDGNAKLIKLKCPPDKIIGALVEVRVQF